MFEKEEVQLLIPKWQLGILLISSVVLLLTGIIFENYMADLTIWFLACGFALFLPAYVILGMDIASRRITHLWFMAMLTLPVIAPFAYFLMRDKINLIEPEVV